jgi:hypothetical protein
VVRNVARVCYFVDPNANSMNAEAAESLHSNAWLWKMRGSLLVVATKYHKGRHWTNSFSECIDVVRALERLHKAGFVHGDIRAFNIIFGAGELIDFDFGGRVNLNDGTPKYPTGYKRVLPDGRRLGKPGNPISMHDDWCALMDVMTVFHEIDYVERYAVQSREFREEVTKLVERDLTMDELIKDGGIVEGVAAAAVKLLTIAEKSGCKIAPGMNFMQDLQDFGLYPEDENAGGTTAVDAAHHRDASNLATGSPERA